jgi:hypothetical protein
MRRRLLLAVIALQVTVPMTALILRLLQDGEAIRFGWHMYAGMP